MLYTSPHPPPPSLLPYYPPGQKLSYHDLPSASYSYGVSTAISPSTIGLKSLVEGKFQPANPDLPHRKAYAKMGLPKSIRTGVFGASSANRTPLAELMEADKELLPGAPTFRAGSRDTGILDMSSMRHATRELRRGDTRGSALLRVLRSTGATAAAPLSSLDTTRAVVACVDTARAAAGHMKTTARPLDAHLAPKVGIPPLWKSRFFEGAEIRTQLDGHPSARVQYSSYVPQSMRPMTR